MLTYWLNGLMDLWMRKKRRGVKGEEQGVDLVK